MPDYRKQNLCSGGEVRFTSWDGDVVEIGTVKCVHCGGHFPIAPGKTKGRGFCTNCNGYICGEKCLECVPEERMLDELEGIVDPTAVSVGGKFNGIWVP